MANSKQVALLVNCIEKWNAWRHENQKIRPELSSLSLANYNLQGANLAFANLTNTDLSGSNLRAACLWGADLRNANLTRADIRGAYLCVLGEDHSVENPARIDGAVIDDIIWTSTDEPARPSNECAYDLLVTSGLQNAVTLKPNSWSRIAKKAIRITRRENGGSSWDDYANKALDGTGLIQSIKRAEKADKSIILATQTITKQLIAYLKRNPTALDQIQPRQFEELIGEILSSHGWQVDITKQTRDGGYDIFAISPKSMGIQSSWIVECKKYSRGRRKVGVNIVRSLWGLKCQMNVGGAMLAATSGFSADAQMFKHDLGSHSEYNLELRDYSSILEWINEYKPHPSGKLYLENNRLSIS